jgi:hypothetical protein
LDRAFLLPHLIGKTPDFQDPDGNLQSVAKIPDALFIPVGLATP